jgi:hypothetical protein
MAGHARSHPPQGRAGQVGAIALDHKETRMKMTRRIHQERDKWGPVIKAKKISLE